MIKGLSIQEERNKIKLKHIEKERKNLLDLISTSRERLRVLSIQRENIIMLKEE